MIKTSFLLTEYLKHTKDASTANSDLGKERIAHHYDFLLAEADNYVVERTKYGILKENQRSYLLSPDYIQMKTVRAKNSAGDWVPVAEVPSLDKWQALTMNHAEQSEIPYGWIIINEQGNLHLEIHPLPDADGDTDSPNLEVVYEGYQDRLLFPSDVTSPGTVALTQGSAAVVGSSTTFPSAAAGRFILPTGGKYWYEIKTRTSNTALVLVNYFQEDDITGSAYTIAEMMRLPREFHYTPVWGAVWDYYMSSNAKKAKEYEARFATELKLLRAKYAKKTKGAVIPGRRVGGGGGYVPRNYPRGPITYIG